MLKPNEIENAEVSEISWTKIKKLNEITVINQEELHHHSQTNNELPSILPQSSFQPESGNHSR